MAVLNLIKKKKKNKKQLLQYPKRADVCVYILCIYYIYRQINYFQMEKKKKWKISKQNVLKITISALCKLEL